MNRRTLATKQFLTSTGYASDGIIDISDITSDWTVVIEVMKVEGTDPTYQIDFEDSRNAFDDFITRFGAVGISDLGDQNYAPDANANVKRFTFNKRDFPGARFGVAGTTAQIDLVRLGGTGTPKVTFQAWVEY